MRRCLAIVYAIVSFALPPAWAAEPRQLASAAEPQRCVHAAIVLWGDGRHDDSAALNAWFRGADAV